MIAAETLDERVDFGRGPGYSERDISARAGAGRQAWGSGSLVGGGGSEMLAPVQRILFTLLALPVLVLGFGPAANADTIYVSWDGSGDYLTIQEGINAASDGDEVVVCDGVYTGVGNKDLDFCGMAITVRSENGPNRCKIDCEGHGRGFSFTQGETPAAVVDGFTIRNGYADHGGGVYCNDSGPTIINCLITWNSGDEYNKGGGIYCVNSSAMIANCTIRENWASSPVQNSLDGHGRLVVLRVNGWSTWRTSSDGDGTTADDGAGGVLDTNRHAAASTGPSVLRAAERCAG